MNQISAISYVFSAKGVGSRQPGATPQVFWMAKSALKARFISEALSRAFSAGRVIPLNTWGVAPGCFVR